MTGNGVNDAPELAQADGKMMQNLSWATGYNVVAIPLAAGVLSWGLLLSVSPAIGAGLMAVGTVVVAINARTLKLG